MIPRRIEAYKKYGMDVHPGQGKALYVVEYVRHGSIPGVRSKGWFNMVYARIDRARDAARSKPGFKEYLAIPDYVYECEEEET